MSGKGRLKRASLYSQLLLSFLLLVVVPSLIISVSTAWASYENANGRAIDQLNSIVELKSSEIDTWISEQTVGLDMLIDDQRLDEFILPYLTSRLSVQETDRIKRGVQDALSSSMAKTGYFEHICLLDRGGTVLVSTDPSWDGRDLSGAEYFIQGLQRNFITPPLLGSKPDGQATIVSAHPIVAPGQGSVGVLAGYSDIGSLNRIMREPMGLGQSGESYLVGLDYMPLTQLRFPPRPDLTAIRTEGTRLALENRLVGHGLYRDYRNVPVMGAYAWLPVLQIALIVEQDQAEVLGPVYATLIANLGVALAAVMLTMLAALVIARRITTPLASLSGAASKIALGELDQSVAVSRLDEIGRLGQAFNLMSERVHSLVDQLKAELAERKTAESRLLQEHLRALQYFDNAAVLMLVLDSEGRVVQLNRKGHEILGYAEGELIGIDWFATCIPEQERGAVREVFARLMRGVQKDMETNENHALTKSGVLKLLSWHNSFVQDPEGRIIGLLSSGADVTERRAAEEQVRRSLSEKEALLRELYHRTKNNMGVITALLDLQAEELGDERVTAAFTDTQNRIRSMALVHQKLYESKDLSRVSLRDYMTDLAELLMDSYQSLSHRVSVSYDLEDITVLIDTAIPCGLVINELVSNAFKYAFPGDRAGKISLGLKRMENGEILLKVEDDGVGLPSGFDPGKDGRMGFQTVFSLGERQLNGRIRIVSAGGLSCQLKFSDVLYQPRV